MSGQTVHLEPIVLQGRIYAEGKKYPEEYEGAFTVTIINGVASVSGLVGRVTQEGYRDFLEKLNYFGVESVEYVRMEDGETIAKIRRGIKGAY